MTIAKVSDIMWSQSRKGKTKVNLDETLYHKEHKLSTKKRKEVKKNDKGGGKRNN